jgi:hypothetical protein
MHLVLRGDGVDRLNALQGFERDPGFQLCTMLTSFLGHGDRSSEFGLTIRPVQLLGTTPDWWLLDSAARAAAWMVSSEEAHAMIVQLSLLGYVPLDP